MRIWFPETQQHSYVGQQNQSVSDVQFIYCISVFINTFKRKSEKTFSERELISAYVSTHTLKVCLRKWFIMLGWYASKTSS